MIDPKEVIVAIIGFFLISVISPIGLTYTATINSTFNATAAAGVTAASLAPILTIFQVLLPVMYLIGAALYFVPKLRE